MKEAFGFSPAFAGPPFQLQQERRDGLFSFCDRGERRVPDAVAEVLLPCRAFRPENSHNDAHRSDGTQRKSRRRFVRPPQTYAFIILVQPNTRC